MDVIFQEMERGNFSFLILIVGILQLIVMFIKGPGRSSGGKEIFMELKLYRVRKIWDDPDSQIGAFSILQNAINCVDFHPEYSVFDEGGNLVYRGRMAKEETK